eukprot:3054114-Pyramimonas_sp.AAC.1
MSAMLLRMPARATTTSRAWSPWKHYCEIPTLPAQSACAKPAIQYGNGVLDRGDDALRARPSRIGKLSGSDD